MTGNLHTLHLLQNDKKKNLLPNHHNRGSIFPCNTMTLFPFIVQSIDSRTTLMNVAAAHSTCPHFRHRLPTKGISNQNARIIDQSYASTLVEEEEEEEREKKKRKLEALRASATGFISRCGRGNLLAALTSFMDIAQQQGKKFFEDKSRGVGGALLECPCGTFVFNCGGSLICPAQSFLTLSELVNYKLFFELRENYCVLHYYVFRLRCFIYRL